MSNVQDTTAQREGPKAIQRNLLIRIPQSAIRILSGGESGRGRPRSQGFRIRSGLTLVELLVTMAVLTVVLGLALGLMVESDRASREMLRFEAGLQYCQQTMDEAVRLVRAAVPPAALQGVAPGLLAPRYTRKELALVVAEAGGFSRVLLDTADLENSQAAIRRRSLTLGGGAATTQTAELSRISRPERFEPRIRFGYAAAPTPGQAVNYVDEWTSATPPALVRITIRARVGNRTAHSGDIELQTAVIPGLIPAGAAVQAAAVQVTTPEPVAPAKTAASRGKGAASSRVLEAIEPAAKKVGAENADTGKPLKVITAAPVARVVNRAKLNQLKEGSGR